MGCSGQFLCRFTEISNDLIELLPYYREGIEKKEKCKQLVVLDI